MSSRELNLDLLLDPDFDLTTYGLTQTYVPVAPTHTLTHTHVPTHTLTHAQTYTHTDLPIDLGAGSVRYHTLYTARPAVPIHTTYTHTAGYSHTPGAYPHTVYQLSPSTHTLPANTTTFFPLNGTSYSAPIMEGHQHMNGYAAVPLQMQHGNGYFLTTTPANVGSMTTTTVPAGPPQSAIPNGDASVVELLSILDSVTNLNSSSPQIALSPLQPEELAHASSLETQSPGSQLSPSVVDVKPFGNGKLQQPQQYVQQAQQQPQQEQQQQENQQQQHHHHQCADCQTTFAEFTDLEKHYLVVHDKKHICKFCDKPFPRQFDLQRHERVHTGERPFVCSICAKSFNQKCSLVMHERTHTGDKPYQCRFCDMSFSESTNRVKHERIHTGEKPYECKICSKRFTSSSHMHRHEKTHLGTPQERRNAAAAAAAASAAATTTNGGAAAGSSNTSTNGTPAATPVSNGTADHNSHLSTCQHCFMEFDDPAACTSHEAICPTKDLQDRPLSQTSLV